MAFEMTGRRATLRVGGRPALALDRFTFATRDPSMGGGWRLDGHVAARDDYWLGQAETFDLRVDLARSSWRWTVPAAAVVVDGETATITGEGEPQHG